MKSHLKFENLNMKIALPYNHDPNLIKLIKKYQKHIYTIYMPPPKNLMFSGDVTQNINWENYENELFSFHNNLKKLNIEISMLYNVTTYYKTSDYPIFSSTDLYKFTKKLLTKGITRFVIADISLAMVIKQHFPQIKIEVSLNAFINTIKKAIHWLDDINPDTFCVAEDMNKDLNFIKNLKKVTHKPLKILVNSRCQVDCPYSQSHANLLSLGIPVSPYMCGTVQAQKPWLLYRGNAIVPYNLRYYKNLITYIKFLGRTQPTEIIERDLKLYIDHPNSRAYSLNHGIINANYRHYDDLGHFIIRNIPHPYLKDEPTDVFKKVTTCSRNCQICNWCFNRWKKDWNIKKPIDPIKGIIYPYKEFF